ncbi:MAG: DUF2225 domain-containing protein [Akkermansiaceae bacterium]
MKRTSLFVLLLFAHTGGLSASISAPAEFTCPIDLTKFSGIKNLSGYSDGMRLDLKQIGAITQPWALPDCPKCHFVIFDEDASKKKIRKLRPFILSDSYKEVASRPSYYRLAIIQAHQKRPSFDIGWSYLRASWQSEKLKEEYADCMKKALGAFSKASEGLAKAPKKRKDQEEHDDYLVSCYLQIELLRKLARFDEASKAISNFPAIGKTEIEWLSDVLKYQKKLIEAKDAEEHNIADAVPEE